MASRSFDEIVVDLITYVLRQNPKLDVSPGQVIRDASIDGPASQMANLYSEVDSVRNAQSILNANSMSVQDLNNLVANFGITRKLATPATSSVVFYTPTQPTSDIDIPAGTVVSTSPGTGAVQQRFRTTNTLRFLSSLEAVYYNVETGNWEITADVIAETSGSGANVGPYTINQVIGSNLPFRVQNRISASGGTDQESNRNLATRAINAFLGNNKGTKNGYLGTVQGQSNVLDALVVAAGDNLMIRDGGNGGKVDIWVLTSSLASTEVNSTSDSRLEFVWNNTQQASLGYKFSFPFLPVDIESSILLTGTIGIANPQTVTLFESRNPSPTNLGYINAGEYHYTLNKADNLDTAHSIEADDYIEWNPVTLEKLRIYNGNTILTIDIIYSYDKTINDLQDLIDSDSNKIVTADVLVKAARKVSLDIQANVTLDSAFKETPNSQNQTQDNIIAAIVTDINSTKMGVKYEKADLIQVIHNVNGVDNIDLGSVKITRKLNSIYGIADEDIENFNADANEYIVAGNITINIL